MDTVPLSLLNMDRYSRTYSFDISNGVAAAEMEQNAADRDTSTVTTQTRAEYMEELLNSKPSEIYEVPRMQRDTFLELCGWLEANTDLTSTRSISIQERVLMFLWALNFNASCRQVKHRFHHSSETVNRQASLRPRGPTCFRHVLILMAM